MQGPNEVEVKLCLSGDAQAVTKRLTAARFHVRVPRVFEANTLYDTETQTLRNRGAILRLRQVGDKNVLTWKGHGQPGKFKDRPELETTVGSFETAQSIFANLGYHPSFRYEKYRTEFQDPTDNDGIVTLDETPIGIFLELEGPGEWIDRTARRLGFSEKEYIIESYGRLYLEDCQRRGIQPSHMVFVPELEGAANRRTS
jgi:adenylate cyclase class 2